MDAQADWSETAQLVADQLRRHLPTPDVLTAEQRLGSPDDYHGHTLHVEPDGSFSIVGLVWRPGQMTRIHDHLTWCVFGVIQGVEHEELFDADLNLIGRDENQVGDVSGFAPPGDIHRVHNTGDTTAISIHVYGTDITPRRLQRPPLLRLTEPCHSPAYRTSPSHSTASAPVKARAATSISVTPGIGCTNGCSPPGGGRPAAAAASTTPSPGSSAARIGAEIMGAGKWGHPGWHEDPDWKGAWGPNPPFHTPVFVLTHHTRPSIEMEGGTTYHFLDASPAEALETAREAADGKDVRIGGGPTMIRDFLAAGLVDHAHIVVVPILLGRGVRLWDGLEGLEKDYDVEATPSPSGVTHVTFTRTGGLNRRSAGAASCW